VLIPYAVVSVASSNALTILARLLDKMVVVNSHKAGNKIIWECGESGKGWNL